jgi:hypothetical protein
MASIPCNIPFALFRLGSGNIFQNIPLFMEQMANPTVFQTVLSLSAPTLTLFPVQA